MDDVRHANGSVVDNILQFLLQQAGFPDAVVDRGHKGELHAFIRAVIGCCTAIRAASGGRTVLGPASSLECSAAWGGSSTTLLDRQGTARNSAT